MRLEVLMNMLAYKIKLAVIIALMLLIAVLATNYLLDLQLALGPFGANPRSDYTLVGLIFAVVVFLVPPDIKTVAEYRRRQIEERGNRRGRET